MNIFAPLRAFGILVSIGGTLAVLGKTLLVPVPIEPAPTPVKFPGKAPLPAWETLIDEPDPTRPNTTRYRHPHGEREIELEMQFIPNLPTHYVRNPLIDVRFLPRGHLPLDAGLHFYVNSRGKILTNRQSDTPIDARVDSRETSAHSGYGIWTADQHLHLSTIVTPAGDTSMATRWIARSLYVDHVNMRVVGQWLLGRTMLPDRRCVLVHFAIPATGPTGDQEDTRVLDDAWSEWQRAFRPVFSK